MYTLLFCFFLNNRGHGSEEASLNWLQKACRFPAGRSHPAVLPHLWAHLDGQRSSDITGTGHPAGSHCGDSAASGVPSPVTGHVAPGPCGAAHMSTHLSYKAALEAITLLEALRGEANKEGRVREFTSSHPLQGLCSEVMNVQLLWGKEAKHRWFGSSWKLSGELGVITSLLPEKPCKPP